MYLMMLNRVDTASSRKDGLSRILNLNSYNSRQILDGCNMSRVVKRLYSIEGYPDVVACSFNK
jgi:hypothetical protein